MLLRHSFCRLPTPSSWISRASPAVMPLRAKVTNPAFGSTAKVWTLPVDLLSRIRFRTWLTVDRCPPLPISPKSCPATSPMTFCSIPSTESD